MPLSTKTRFVEVGLTIDPYHLEFTKQNRLVFIVIMKVFLCSIKHFFVLSLFLIPFITKNIICLNAFVKFEIFDITVN